jgi:RNA polymerase sigma factor (sigma-70 family)
MRTERSGTDFAALVEKAVRKDREAIAILAADYPDLLAAWIRGSNADSRLTRGANRPSDLVQQFFVRLLGPSPCPSEADSAGTCPPGRVKGAAATDIPTPVAYFRSALINEGKILRKKALAEKRGGGRQVAVTTSFFASIAGSGATPSQFALANEFQERVRDALDRLGENDRLFFQMCLERRCWEEIAAAENKKPNTVRQRFSRLARKVLAQAN